MRRGTSDATSTKGSWGAYWLSTARSPLRHFGNAETFYSLSSGDPPRKTWAVGEPPGGASDSRKVELGAKNDGYDSSDNFLARMRTPNEDAVACPPGVGMGRFKASMSVTTDKSDYAPGSTAIFTVSALRPGSSVNFQVADLASAPGANGVADIYKPFSVTDGGAGDLDGKVNGVVVAQWRVPANGQATGADLEVSATADGQSTTAFFSDAANKIVTENQKAGTPMSAWSIHGSLTNEGDSQIEGFTTQISVTAGQTVSFKIDTALNGYTIDIYRLGYYGGNGATLGHLDAPHRRRQPAQSPVQQRDEHCRCR